MRTRTSVELYPGGCRLVEVALPPRRRGPIASDVRVRTWVSQIPEAEGGVNTVGATYTSPLRTLRDKRKLAREAWVTVWGLRSVQQFLRLPPAKPADLEALAIRDARKDLASLETGTDRATVSVVVGGEAQVGSHRRREVSLVGVSTAEVRRRIQPLVDAGFVVEGVLTPALALTAVARMQRDVLPGTATAYVALVERATCMAIVRDGLLLFARELPWGHDRAAAPSTQEALGTRLASELRRSVLFFKQTFRSAVEGVVVCGDMPNLRALTTPLGAALGVPVQPLDALTGIDAAALPPSADAFRADVPALRLSIAVGADPSPRANLLPAAIRLSRAARAQMTRLAGAAAAGVLLVVGAYAMVERSASGYASERQQIEQQLAQLEPEARRLDELRRTAAVAAARRSAMGAFESQGPRIARLLEALSQAVSDDVVLTSSVTEAAGMYWRTTVTGVAITDDAASGQAAVNRLIASLSASPYVGAPVQPPSLRVVSGTAAASTAAGGQAAAIPEGLSGVEFVLVFEVAK